MNVENEIAINKENKIISNKYRILLKSAKPFLHEDDQKIIRKAFKLALEASSGMRRKTGDPQIMHSLEIAIISVKEIGLGTTAIVSALLHDVLENSEILIEDIEESFGGKVASIVEGLSKISGNFEYGSSKQAENFRKMLLTIARDVRVILIKLADRLHDMRTLGSISKTSQLRIASETIYIYAPLAHKLGLYSIKSEMEDLYLKFSLPESYNHIADTLNASKDARNRFIRKFTQPIQAVLKKNNFLAVVKGRPKSIYSIHKKMIIQNVSMDEIYDLFAIRIILNTKLETEKEDCWKVYSFLTELYKPKPERLRDWISIPKTNGYESLHTTVMSPSGQWVEIQIRTKRMDEIAEKGYAAHWKYKESQDKRNKKGNKSNESGLDLWRTMVRSFIQERKVSAIEFIDDFRSTLFSDEIFVFTPKGELIGIAKDTSALDFAFQIHTDLGHKCIGAKVNGKLVSIDHKLKNGDQVEILTSNKQMPKHEWLSHVSSSKARSYIKNFIRSHIKESEKQGKKILEEICDEIEVSLKNGVLGRIQTFFGAENAQHFYRMIANKRVAVNSIRKFLRIIEAQTLEQQHQINQETTFSTRIIDKNKAKGDNKDELIIGDNIDQLSYQYATCCNPIYGDEVFGFVTVNEGIKIHQTTCPNGIALMSKFAYRTIKATWAPKEKNQLYHCNIKIEGMDRKKLLNDITCVISENLSIAITSIKLDVRHKLITGHITVNTEGKQQLDTLVERLKDLDGVLKVSRQINSTVYNI